MFLDFAHFLPERGSAALVELAGCAAKKFLMPIDLTDRLGPSDILGILSRMHLGTPSLLTHLQDTSFPQYNWPQGWKPRHHEICEYQSTSKILAERMLKYRRISQCQAAKQVSAAFILRNISPKPTDESTFGRGTKPVLVAHLFCSFSLVGCQQRVHLLLQPFSSCLGQCRCLIRLLPDQLICTTPCTPPC